MNTTIYITISLNGNFLDRIFWRENDRDERNNEYLVLSLSEGLDATVFHAQWADGYLFICESMIASNPCIL